MPSTRRSKAALASAPKTSSEARNPPNRKFKGSSPKVTGRRSKSNWKTDRITQLLRLGENNDYPPSIEEINAATRIIDLETAIQNSKVTDHDKIEKKIKEAFLKLNAVLSKRRPTENPITGEDSSNPIELEDWDKSDSENGTGEIKTPDEGKAKLISYEMLLDTDDEGSQNDDQMEEASEVSHNATDRLTLNSGTDDEIYIEGDEMEESYAENNMEIDQADTKVSQDPETENESKSETDKNEMDVEFEQRHSPESNEQDSHTTKDTGKASSLTKASQSTNTCKEKSSKVPSNKADGNSDTNTPKPDQKTENPYNNKKKQQHKFRERDDEGCSLRRKEHKSNRSIHLQS